MKILLGIVLVLGLTQALPIQDARLDELSTILELIRQRMVGPISQEIPRPFASFHPTTIENKGQDVRDQWKGFVWKGFFGPSIKRRPFSSMDFRIIGR